MIRKLTSKLESIKRKCILSGISDIMVVKWSNNQYKSTPFTVCFGSPATTTNKITIFVNNKLINQTNFQIDQYGNIDPLIPSQNILRSFNLQPGKNDIQFILNQNEKSLSCQIHLFDQNDKIIVSDVDGTLTKSDFYGMINNVIKRNHIHNGYIEFIESAEKNGYKIVWLTMRSISMYNLSKSYIKMHTLTPGPLFAWPEQILAALRKQLTKNTIDPKTFLLKNIRDIFPNDVNPFAGALGNRQNDALAYTIAQVPHESIVQRWGDHQKISYDHMSQQIQNYFPKLKKQKPRKIQQKVILEGSIDSQIIEKGDKNVLSSLKTMDSMSSPISISNNQIKHKDQKLKSGKQ